MGKILTKNAIIYRLRFVLWQFGQIQTFNYLEFLASGNLLSANNLSKQYAYTLYAKGFSAFLTYPRGQELAHFPIVTSQRFYTKCQFIPFKIIQCECFHSRRIVIKLLIKRW